ncbi:MAG: hypothetical protein GXO02_03835 [Epsilonproteobacteria bacterium]|nr:hypothetical protein [Campylobacterota bacterium]
MSLVGKDELILLHKYMEPPKRAKSYDLVLSPEFYIVKKEQLPIKYKFQAQKLAPSILDEYLDEDKVYKFIVEKEKDGWSFYAYSPQEIEEFLARFDIKPHQINRIYFADQLSHILLKVPISLDEKRALVLVDNYATIVPKEIIPEDRYIEFSKKLRPKKGFKFQTTQKVKREASDILSKGAIALAALISILGGLYFFEGFLYKKELQKLQEQIANIYDSSPALASKLTRDSIKQKYLTIEKKERRLRELMKIFSNLSSKKSILESLELKDNRVVAKYNVDRKELKRVKSLITAKGLSYQESGNYLIVTGEIK